MVGDTVGRSRHNGRVWNGGDGTQRLGRLEVSRSLATRDVDAGWSHVVTLADLKRAVLGVVRDIVLTPKTIIDVLAKLTLVMAIRVTDFHTEAITTHETDAGSVCAPLAIK